MLASKCVSVTIRQNPNQEITVLPRDQKQIGEHTKNQVVCCPLPFPPSPFSAHTITTRSLCVWYKNEHTQTHTHTQRHTQTHTQTHTHTRTHTKLCNCQHTPLIEPGKPPLLSLLLQDDILSRLTCVCDQFRKRTQGQERTHHVKKKNPKQTHTKQNKHTDICLANRIHHARFTACLCICDRSKRSCEIVAMTPAPRPQGNGELDGGRWREAYLPTMLYDRCPSICHWSGGRKRGREREKGGYIRAAPVS